MSRMLANNQVIQAQSQKLSGYYWQNFGLNRKSFGPNFVNVDAKGSGISTSIVALAMQSGMTCCLFICSEGRTPCTTYSVSPD